MTKLQVTAVKMMPMAEGVGIGPVAQMIDDKGLFAPNELITKAAIAMLEELYRWAAALKPMRATSRGS